MFFSFFSLERRRVFFHGESLGGHERGDEHGICSALKYRCLNLRPPPRAGPARPLPRAGNALSNSYLRANTSIALFSRRATTAAASSVHVSAGSRERNAGPFPSVRTHKNRMPLKFWTAA